MRDRQSVHGEEKSGHRRRTEGWKIETPEPITKRAWVPWLAGLGNRGEDCGALVGRRACEGPPNKLRSQPAMRVVEIFAKFKGDRGMSRKANTWYIPLLNLLSSGIG
jgi:hypothetical protein